MLLETNSSPTCTPLFPLFAESEAVLVYRWHLREALRSVSKISLAHITGQTSLHSNWSAIIFCITGEAKCLYLNKTLLLPLSPPRFKFIVCTLFLPRLLLNTPCCLLLCIKMICVDRGLSEHFALSAPAFAFVLYFMQQKRNSQQGDFLKDFSLTICLKRDAAREDREVCFFNPFSKVSEEITQGFHDTAMTRGACCSSWAPGPIGIS